MLRLHLAVWLMITLMIVPFPCFNLTAAAIAAPDEEPFPGFEDYVRSSMAQTDTPGLAVSIVKGDRTVFCKGYGVTKLGSNEKVDEHTLFQMASCSKPMTATVCGMLVDDGKMDWDGKVIDYLPWFQLSDPWATREITMRDLLCHRSGMHATDYQWVGSVLTRDDILHRIRYQPLEEGFRYKHTYQNVLYMVAGQAAVSAAQETDFESLMQNKLFHPLGMNETGTTHEALLASNNKAYPHTKIDGKMVVIPFRNCEAIAAAGGINSNAIDLANWIKLQIGRGSFNGKQLINEPTITEMQSPQIVTPQDAPLVKALPDVFQFFGYGLGWGIFYYRGHLVVRHSGGIEGMRTTVVYLPEKNIGFDILTNNDSANTACIHGIAYWLIDHYMDLPSRDWTAVICKAWDSDKAWFDEGWKKTQDERVFGTHPSLPLAKYCGQYSSQVMGDLTVEQVGNHLVLTFGERVADLTHFNYDTFSLQWNQYLTPNANLVNFSLGRDGEIVEMEMEYAGKFKKVS